MLAKDVDDLVAVHDVAVLIDGQAAVGVAVVGKAHVEVILAHEAAQPLDVRRTGVAVDVHAVRLRVDDKRLRAQRLEHGARDIPCAAVRAVEAHAHVLVGMARQRDQVADIAVAAGDVVDDLAQRLARRGGHVTLEAQGRQIAVQIALDGVGRFVVHLLAAAVDELDAVVRERVVGRGDHHTAVEAVHARDVRHGGRRRHMQHVGVRAGRGQARDDRIFKHVAGAAGVLADDDAGLPALPRAVIPANELADFIRMLAGEVHIRLAAKSVCSEIFAHENFLSGVPLRWRTPRTFC